MEFEAVIGLEVHVQLKTRTKIFCRCRNHFGDEANRWVCPVCLGYPGTLPVLNLEAVDLAVRLSLALGCEVREESVFARKNYFYADLPKGYQISQFDKPIAERGSLPLLKAGRSIGIHRLHLEEDAGKLLHEVPGGGPLPGKSLVDFNRCGVPLAEIVSEPEIRTAAEAMEYLQTMRQVLLYTGTSDGNMEEGSLRCDANVSIRPVGSAELGTKTEVKNLNSFRHVGKAIDYEIERQTALLEHGQPIVQETRSFDAGSGMTRTLRSKEEAHDYRYFPEPDLPLLVVSRESIEAHRQALPELPWERQTRLVNELRLTREDALQITSSVELASYYESVLVFFPDHPRTVANWVTTEIARELKERDGRPEDLLAPEKLADLLAEVEKGTLSATAAKEVFAVLIESGDSVTAIIDRLGLRQVRDEGQLSEWVDEAIREHPQAAAEFREGRQQAIGFLVGQVMKASRGSADPRRVRELLLNVLSS